MWRKQSEGKPSSSATGSYDSPSYAPPASSTPASSYVPPSSATFLSGPDSSADSTVLTRGIRIKGDLAGKGEITIDGELIGSAHVSDARVAVGPNGHVKADIEAREVIVRGIVEGNLRGRDRVVLGATGSVKGDIDAARVVIEDGAIFKGRVEIGRETLQRHEHEAARKSVAAPAAQAAPVQKAAAPAPGAAPPKPSPTPVQTLPASSTPSSTPSSTTSGSSTSSSAPAKDSVPAPVGGSGGSR
ncbi:MAG TPA: polymer-forming cytoskeletal protein [Candidatus Acidoferrales bacterium]|nr:polymer-forming cytoskeletal protein [Candidatus Acidoferrales bacterium]